MDFIVDRKPPASPPVFNASARPSLLQRQCACGQHTGEGECESCRKKREGMLQRSSMNTSLLNQTPPIVHDVLRSPGQPLDPATRAFMEPRFGHDFSQVRVHTDPRAAESARAVDALAYTIGRDVVFGTGQYAPGTIAGQRLIAHELVHTLQQGMSAGLQRQAIVIGPAGDSYEQEADQAAARIITGEGDFIAHHRSSPILRRQSVEVHQSPQSSEPNLALQQGVPAEKWSESIEAQYRARGDSLRANAIHNCRIRGSTACNRILTPIEVDRLFRLSRESHGDRNQIAAGLASILPAVGPSLAPGPPPGLFPPPVVTPPVPPPPVVVPPVALPPVVTPPVVPPVAPAAGAGVGTAITVTGVAALIAICVYASYELWTLGRFQQELRAQGFVIMEDPLAVCIGGCHIPSRPSLSPFPNFPSGPSLAPRTGPLSPEERDLIDRWIREQEPRGSGQTIQPQPVPRQTAPINIGELPHERRSPTQTCTNQVLDQLQTEKDRICNSIPGPSCSPSRSPKMLARIPCSQIRARIQAFRDCIAIRQRIQTECFGGVPDPVHQRALNELNNGLTACLNLLAQNCAPGHPMANL